MRAANHIVIAASVIGILACASCRKSPSPPSGVSLPSWVPDWRIAINASKIQQTIVWQALDVKCDTVNAKRADDRYLLVHAHLLRPCGKAAQCRSLACECKACIFSRVALRTTYGHPVVAALSANASQDLCVALLVFEGCQIGFWVAQIQDTSDTPSDMRDVREAWTICAPIELPLHTLGCLYITNRRTVMSTEEVLLG